MPYLKFKHCMYYTGRHVNLIIVTKWTISTNSCCDKMDYIHHFFLFLNKLEKYFVALIYDINCYTNKNKNVCRGSGGPWGPPYKVAGAPKFCINKMNINTNCTTLGYQIIALGTSLCRQNISSCVVIIHKHAWRIIL